MIGPALLLLVAVIGGGLVGGWAGAVVGGFVGLAATASVALGAVSWAHRIGSLLDAEEAREMAPCPPGFSRVCQAVYERLLEAPDR